VTLGRYPRNVAPALERISPPLAGVLRVISARWGPLILQALADGHVRFNDLHRHLTGVSHKVLIETLRMLQDENLVRKVTVTDPTQDRDVAEYRLTDVGAELLGWLDDVRAWAERRTQLGGPQ
jgi:DNA-binding HxlR family transcriptional regulator